MIADDRIERAPLRAALGCWLREKRKLPRCEYIFDVFHNCARDEMHILLILFRPVIHEDETSSDALRLYARHAEAEVKRQGVHGIVWHTIGMKLVSWNVNGIRSIHKKGELTAFLERVKPDIVCLQETKAQEHESPVDLPDYHEFWHSSQARKGYSGTAIFSTVEPLDVKYGFPADILKKFNMDGDAYGHPDKEGRVIVAEFEPFFVATVYTPNSKDDLSRIPLRHKLWDPAFLAYMIQLEEEKPVIFCGDLNVAHTPDDLANPKPNEGKKGFTEEEREGIDNMIEAGFVDTFRLFTKGNGHYTWWSHFSNARARNVGWRIDYFFASKSLIPHIKRSVIYTDAYGSDHCPILLELDIEA